MKNKYKEYKQLNLPQIGKEIQEYWDNNTIFEKSIEIRKEAKPFVFYEGPPSANGVPGIHHVMARTIKDLFCRYKTLKGHLVKRKAGWDTHGLPVEISVEKSLNITKEDIGSKITVEEYNEACRKDVMRYKDKWDELTKQIGFWVDLEDPYITFDNKYIESVWYLLSELYKKDLLYKGYNIQPYSPAAGTGLSTHELNQPGCYKMVKDTTVVAQFKVIRDEKSEILFNKVFGELFFMAWTTTPWTLPSNTALAVGKNIDYILVKTYNQYTSKPITVIIAEALFNQHFSEKNKDVSFDDYKEGDKKIPYEIIGRTKGKEIAGIRYEQLLEYAQPEEGDAFKVVVGDFVSTEDGTGIVHIAPSFGADDFRTAQQNKLGSLTLVDKQGRFTDCMGEFAGRFVKVEYDPGYNKETDRSVDVDIAIKLKQENKAFKVEKYEHTYPHCWRTDKPILYYPLDSWFVKTTAYKDRLLELNKTINWKPQSTGVGRFANWLENLVDWNLSRSRFWGVPLPIWTNEERNEQKIISSIEELQKEIDKSIAAGVMTKNPLADFSAGDFSKKNYEIFDLHRPYVDDIILVSDKGEKMHRETDLIDVWFDSGAMPYAQHHFPFENQDIFKSSYPADFIAEGVDQTRGWFFTLHAIAVMLFDSVAYKTVVSNGLVLDDKGNKMSKRLGNAIDPFITVNKYGPDATRWYIITNSQPWDNLKFNTDGVAEVQRKFFSTLHNTYAFFALYANIDNFTYEESDIPIEERPEIDRWIISELNTLVEKVDTYYNEYEPTKAGREIQHFVYDLLSNWYVRLCRRRFWKGSYSKDKISAYQTLYKCLETIAQISSPIAPFFMDNLFLDLNNATNKIKAESVHLTEFPVPDTKLIDPELEKRMQLAQKVSSMVLSLRKKENIRVRQPLNKIMIPATLEIKKLLESASNIILHEVNVKELEIITEQSSIWKKKIKPDFKKLGPRFGKNMKSVAAVINTFDQNDIREFEQNGEYTADINNEKVVLSINEVEIITEDIPGWTITNHGSTTVALDITITEELKEEGIARELINRIQNIRKEKNYEVVDKIVLKIEKHDEINLAINNNSSYICSETLATSLELVDEINSDGKHIVEIINNINTNIFIEKA